MPDTKNIIKRFDEQFPKLEWGKYSDRERVKQFLLTELQALKEEAMDEDIEEDLSDSPLQIGRCQGYGHHRDHVIKVFEKFGIK